jgi:hypothetical protein
MSFSMPFLRGKYIPSLARILCDRLETTRVVLVSTLLHPLQTNTEHLLKLVGLTVDLKGNISTECQHSITLKFLVLRSPPNDGSSWIKGPNTLKYMNNLEQALKLKRLAKTWLAVYFGESSCSKLH